MLQKTRGNALLIALLILLVAVILVEMVMSETSTVAKITDRSRQYQGAQAAANGTIEYAYAVWLKRIAAKHDLLCTTADLAITPPSFPSSSSTPGFVYTSDGALTLTALTKYGTPVLSGSNPDPVISTVPGYPGWWGRTYTYAATVKMTPANSGSNGPVAGARRLFHYTEVPLFQCMFFFQNDLEIYNPATISLKGLIHTNQNLYLSVTSSTDLSIYGQATYSGSTYSTKEPPGAVGSNYDLGNLNPPTWANGGQTVQLQQVSTIWPLGPDLDAVFSDPTNSTNPNVTNGYHELIEPPSISGTYTDPDAISKRRLYNTAANTENQTGSTGGVIIQVTGTNVSSSTIGLTTLNSTTHLPVPVSGKTTLIAVGSGATLTTGTAAVNAFAAALSKKLSTSGSSALSGTSHLYDAREQANVNVVDVDLSKLQTAILGVSGTSGYVNGFSDVIYIYDSSTSSSINAVRILNGSTITDTDGLTIASLNPMYVQGDFNTGGTGTTVPSNGSSSTTTSSNTVAGYTSYPTSIVADAVTLLSSAWTDSKSSSTLSNRTAANTTYNVALLGGYLSSGSGSFSGGAVNYPRFLESWTSKYCTYYGSMVELFPSKSVTKTWQTPGTYYNAPTRRYNFDTNFSTKSPPGSVNAVVLSRGIWSKY